MRSEYVAQQEQFSRSQEQMYYEEDPATPSEAHVDRELRSSSRPVSDYLPQPQPYTFAGNDDADVYDDQDGLDVQVQMEA